VVHAAGALDDGALIRQTWARCAAVLRNKVGGARVLHALTREWPLDFFVLYSAAGGWLGAPGQCAYAAANAELDALARARRASGLPALSVGWGAWAQGGMATQLAASGRDPWAGRGLKPIEPELGLQRLEALWREGATHALVLPIDWSAFLSHLPAGVDAALFPAAARRPAPAAETLPDATLAARLRQLPAGQRRGALMAHLAERALQVLGLDAGTAIDPRRALKDIGLDSLMAVELRNALTRSIGQPLSATLLFDYPNLDALTAYLMRALGLEDAPAPQATAGAPAHGELAALSDEEAEALLMQELSGGPESPGT
jgi:acyl carrier protein